jgi:hypothetical protein
VRFYDLAFWCGEFGGNPRGFFYGSMCGRVQVCKIVQKFYYFTIRETVGVVDCDEICYICAAKYRPIVSTVARRSPKPKVGVQILLGLPRSLPLCLFYCIIDVYLLFLMLKEELSAKVPFKAELLEPFRARGDVLSSGVNVADSKKELDLDDGLLDACKGTKIILDDLETDKPHVFPLKLGESPVSLAIWKDVSCYHIDIFADPVEAVIQDRCSSSNIIANFAFSIGTGDDSNVANLWHRKVETAYRGVQSAGGVRMSDYVMGITDHLMENRAGYLGSPQEIIIGAGQVDVACWLLRNEFEVSDKGKADFLGGHNAALSRTSFGKAKWNLICNADGRIFIDNKLYFYSEEDIPEIGVKGVDRENVRPSQAMRILFSKLISVPEVSSEVVNGDSANFGNRVEDLLAS